MSFPVQEWQSKLQKQVGESQKIIGQFEALCESKKVTKILFCLLAAEPLPKISLSLIGNDI